MFPGPLVVMPVIPSAYGSTVMPQKGLFPDSMQTFLKLGKKKLQVPDRQKDSKLENWGLDPDLALGLEFLILTWEHGTWPTVCMTQNTAPCTRPSSEKHTRKFYPQAWGSCKEAYLLSRIITGRKVIDKPRPLINSRLHVCTPEYQPIAIVTKGA